MIFVLTAANKPAELNPDHIIRADPSGDDRVELTLTTGKLSVFGKLGKWSHEAAPKPKKLPPTKAEREAARLAAHRDQQRKAEAERKAAIEKTKLSELQKAGSAN